ncbi:hypothetical protein [Pantoea sp. C2G6]|uniref:hypothetical protein n=1 Tax=Pantoea sp. C2G6 TaxID=3243084 RepID=UPI003ED89ECD
MKPFHAAAGRNIAAFTTLIKNCGEKVACKPGNVLIFRWFSRVIISITKIVAVA